MIILNLKDGLGNQMFEFAFARFLQSLSNEQTIYLNKTFFDGKKRKSYSLGNFNLSDDVILLNDKDGKRYTFLFVLKLFFCYPGRFIKWMFTNERPKDEETFQYSSKKGLYVHFNTFHSFNITVSRKKYKFIYGNYENYSYVFPVLEKLKKEFEIIGKIPQETQKLMDIISLQEATCVHIRRGDYLDPQWSSLNVCGFDYYQSAIDVVEKKHPNTVFYIFSNTHSDIEWIKNNYKFKQKVEYVDLNNSDFAEMAVMRCCKHFIISNSTFSWWPAVLSDFPYSTVVAPNKWTQNTDEIDWEGMYLPDWIRI